MAAVAARRTGTGVDPQGRRADHPVLPRGRRLERQPFLPEGRGPTAANVGEPFWPHNRPLGASPRDRAAPTGRPHRHVRPPPATDLLIGASPCMGQQFAGQDPPCGHGWPATRGASGKAPGARAVHGCHQGRPRARLGPWAKRLRCGHAVSPLQACSTSGQPGLEVSSERHERLSFSAGEAGRLRRRRCDPHNNPCAGGIN